MARRCLARWVGKAPLNRVWASPGKPLRQTTPTQVVRALRGRRTLGIDRLGKHLLWRLEGGVAVHLHLGMTGKLVRRQGEPRRPTSGSASRFAVTPFTSSTPVALAASSWSRPARSGNSRTWQRSAPTRSTSRWMARASRRGSGNPTAAQGGAHGSSSPRWPGQHPGRGGVVPGSRVADDEAGGI